MVHANISNTERNFHIYNGTVFRLIVSTHTTVLNEMNLWGNKMVKGITTFLNHFCDSDLVLKDTGRRHLGLFQWNGMPLNHLIYI